VLKYLAEQETSNHSTASTAAAVAQVCASNEEFRLRSAPHIKYLVSILYCFSTHQTLYRQNGQEAKLQRLLSPRFSMREILCNARTSISGTSSTAVCIRSSSQLLGQARTSTPQYRIYSNCSRSSLQLPGQPRAPSNPILCVANQAHHPFSFAPQSEHTTASQFPQLASNSNTLHNLRQL